MKEILFLNFISKKDYDAGVQRRRDMCNSFNMKVKNLDLNWPYDINIKYGKFILIKILEIPNSIRILFILFFNKKYNKIKYIVFWPISYSYLWLIPILRLTGKKIIYDYNDDFYRLTRHNSFPYNIISYIFVKIPQNLVLYMSNYNILTVGIYEKSSKFIRKKSIHITTGYNKDLFKPLNVKTKTNKVKIGYFGSIKKSFGLDFIVNKFISNNYNNAELHLYGQNLDVKIPEHKNIIYHGKIAFEKVPNEMNKMDILLNSFNYNDLANYASPVKVFEYMACGKAIISAKVESIKYVLIDEKNALLYKPSNEQEFIQKLNKLINNKKLRIELGKNALIDSKQYTWKEICRKIEKFI